MKLNLLKSHILLLSAIFLFTTCEEPDKEDTTPPEITITSPQNGASVSEIVTITCMASDNKGVEKVELWVNGVTTGIADSTEPYSLDWNTTTYEDGSYSIIVRSYDTNGNTADSEAITLTVDNTVSYPNAVTLGQISYQDGSFIITWSKNNDNDFSSYTVYESTSEDMSGKILIYETNEQADTSYTLMDVSVGAILYYQIIVKDEFGFESSSNVKEASSFMMFRKRYVEIAHAREVKQTDDGGYIVVGGSNDVSMIKLDSEGNKEWSQTFDGSEGLSVDATIDGGYIITGEANSTNGDVLLIKTDSNGNVEWNKTFDGHFGGSVRQTVDGGFIVAGMSYIDPDEQYYRYFLLLKTDSEGNEEWSNTYADDESEGANSLDITSDGGYIMSGTATDDLWLVKADSNGEEEWARRVTSNSDLPVRRETSAIRQTSDGGYIVVSGIAQEAGSDNDDLFLIKTDSEGNKDWEQRFGDANASNWGSSVQQITDSGYIITGAKGCPDNCAVWLIKTDSAGNSEWTTSIESIDDFPGLTGNSIQLTSDGGYIIAGNTGQGYGSLILIKTDPNGSSK